MSAAPSAIEREPADVYAIARLLDITPRRVQQLVREGVLPKVAHGKYPVLPCVHAYIGYWQKKAEAARNGGTPDYKNARARKVEAEAQLKELEFARLRDELVPAASVEGLVREALAPVDHGLRIAPSRLAQAWADRLGLGEGEAVHLLREITDEIRQHVVRACEGDEPLPEDFPARTYLVEAGIETWAELRDCDDLQVVSGIGPAREREIREALG